MSKKLTLEFVKKKFQEAGCELLEDIYINSQTKMSYRCSCGNISKIKWNNFKSGKRCMLCGRKRTENASRHSQKFVELYFKKYDCELLDKYKNSDEKLKFKCKCGEISKITFSTFKKGHRCSKCKYKQISKALSLDENYVIKYFKDQGCELLSKYKNARTKVKYRCICGNISEIVFDSFKNGNRCKKCGIEKKKLQQTLDKTYVFNYFKEQGCELLEEYEKSRIPMLYRCVCGNISKINWNNFKKGNRCKKCGIKKISKSNNYQWIFNREEKLKSILFSGKCRALLKMALQATGQKKNSKTELMLGYTAKDLQNYVTKHPNWYNLKNKKWHLDHKFPIKAFKDYNIKDIKIINCLENLQPMYYKDNLSKNAKYNVEDFEAWIKTKGIILK